MQLAYSESLVFLTKALITPHFLNKTCSIACCRLWWLAFLRITDVAGAHLSKKTGATESRQHALKEKQAFYTSQFPFFSLHLQSVPAQYINIAICFILCLHGNK